MSDDLVSVSSRPRFFRRVLQQLQEPLCFTLPGHFCSERAEQAALATDPEEKHCRYWHNYSSNQTWHLDVALIS